MRISAQSTEYLKVSVTANVTVTSDPVAFAFTAVGVSPTSWTAGSWDTNGQARILVGPGGLVLTIGLWDVWVKVTDNPEIPVRRVGQLAVF